jgi:hypothetical protein
MSDERVGLIENPEEWAKQHSQERWTEDEHGNVISSVGANGNVFTNGHETDGANALALPDPDASLDTDSVVLDGSNVEEYPDAETGDDAEAILKTDDTRMERVIVPEWKRGIWVRNLTSVERDAYVQSLVRMKGRTREVSLRYAQAKLVVLGSCNPNTKARIWKDADVARLAQKNAQAVARIAEVIERLSGLNQNDIEDTIKNSEATLETN